MTAWILLVTVPGPSRVRRGIDRKRRSSSGISLPASIVAQSPSWAELLYWVRSSPGPDWGDLPGQARFAGETRPLHAGSGSARRNGPLRGTQCPAIGKADRSWPWISVDAYLEAHRGDFEEQLKDLDPDSQRQRPAGPRRRHAAGGDVRPRRPGRHGAEGRADRDQAPSARLCRVARSPGQAHAPGLRPLRRPASRAAGALALSAVRADRPRRQPLCSRGHRRQGPDVHSPEGGRGLAQDGRPAAGERQVPDRGRGGGRRRQPRGLRRREHSDSSPATTR